MQFHDLPLIETCAINHLRFLSKKQKNEEKKNEMRKKK